METTFAPATAPVSAPAPVDPATPAAQQVAIRPTVGDAFSRQAGPDAAVRTAGEADTHVYARFSVDQETKRLNVEIVDANGQVIRAIPPESVSEMLRSLGAYRR